MKSENACGRIEGDTARQRRNADACGYRAAMTLQNFAGQWAVTCDPHGRVCLERPWAVHPDDLVGVYTAEPGLFALWRQIRDDLRVHVAQSPPQPYTHRARPLARRVARG